MDLRKSIVTSLLLAIGYIMHQLVPGVVGGMKFDLLLAVVFVCIFINNDFKNVILTALLSGFITALTTTFPGGQVPNVIDKIVACICVYAMIKICGKFKQNSIAIGSISFIGTIISGSVFLMSALFIVGLPAPFKVLFLTIVLPTAFTNCFITVLIYNVVKVALKSSNISFMKN